MSRDRRKKDVQERERTMIDEAREEGIGEPEEGIEPTVPSYAETGGVSDLGVDEPIVPRRLRGDPPPSLEEGEDDDQDQDRTTRDTPRR